MTKQLSVNSIELLPEIDSLIHGSKEDPVNVLKAFDKYSRRTSADIKELEDTINLLKKRSPDSIQYMSIRSCMERISSFKESNGTYYFSFKDQGFEVSSRALGFYVKDFVGELPEGSVLCEQPVKGSRKYERLVLESAIKQWVKDHLSADSLFSESGGSSL